MMKWALLGGAALAVSASGAYADDLAALKAELEALKSRVQELEAKPAPAQLPDGYSLLSVHRGATVVAPQAQRKDDQIDVGRGFTFSVLPAADAAPTTEVTVQGEIRTVLFYENEDFEWDPAGVHQEIDTDDLDVTVRARLNVTGKTETAVGEVGVFIRVQGGDFFDAGGRQAAVDKGWGWWKMSPNWTLTAGFLDNTSAIQAGVDWDFSILGQNGFFGPTNATVEQFRLTYDSGGPFSAAIAVEDPETATNIGPATAGEGAGVDQSDLPGLAGYIMYNGDNVMFQVTGHVEDDDVGDDTDWFVGAGARFGLGDMFTFTAAGMYGEGYARNAGYFFQADNTGFPKVGIGGDDEYWAVSAGFIANLSDDLSAELGGAYGELDGDFGETDSAWGVVGGLYWKPVSQLKVGVTGIYSDREGLENNNVHDWDQEVFEALFTTWMSF
jgi:hypothetical protein